MNWLSYLLAAAAGAANPFQSGANAELNKVLQRPIFTAIAVYLTGTAGILLIQAILREPLPSTEALARVPWWAWAGGALSIASTVAGLMLAQRLGSGIFTGLSVTAAIVTSVTLDHFGVLGFKVHPLSPMRFVGCLLMVAGLWLISKF